MSQTPMDIADAVRMGLAAIADEIRKLREQQQKHHQAGMAAAEADTDRKLAATQKDLSSYCEKMLSGLRDQDAARQEMQQQIDDLHVALARLATERPS